MPVAGRWLELYRTRAWFFSAANILLLVLRNGIWWIPNLPEQVEMGRDLTVNPFKAHLGAQYLLENYFGSIVVHFFRLDQGYSYFIFLVIFTLVALFAACWLVHRKLGFDQAFFLFVLFFSLPVSTVVMTWMGLDTWTFLWMTLCIVVTSTPLLLVSGFFLGTSHFFQGILAFGLLALLQWRLGKSARRTLLVCLGIILGRAGLELWFRIHSFDVQRNAVSALREFHVLNTAHSQFKHLPLFLFSMFGAGWLFAMELYRRLSEKRGILIAAFAFIFALCFLVADHTRIFAMLSWPMMLWLGSNFYLLTGTHHDNLSKSMLLACIVIPPVMLWNDIIYSSHLPTNIELVYRYLTGHLPGNIIMMPYQ